MIGTTISHYKILEKLGEGGMGVVYKAQDTKLNRTVALKFLPDRIQMDADAKARFLQEAQAAAALNHPNICTIHGVEDVGGSLFIVMEYIDGGTLREKLPFQKLDAAITVAIQIGQALQKAHEKNIVHRDVKADNIMLTADGQAKVMDFGLAKLKGALKLTRTSSTVGTLGYMAPEQIQGGSVDHRSDIFSFGVLLFEMITGKLPFHGEHEAAIMYSILNEDPKPIRSLREDVSPELEHVLNRALEKDPEIRYQTIKDATIDLQRTRRDSTRVHRISAATLSEDGTRFAPAGRFQSALKKWWWGIGAVLLVAIAIYVFSGRSAAPSLPPQKTVVFTSDPGRETMPAFSPDGNSIAYVRGDLNDDNTDIYVKLIGAGSPLHLTTSAAADRYPAWSPEGKFIAFERREGKNHSYYVIPALGGNERKIVDVQSSAVGDWARGGIDWSPDGSSLAVSAPDSSGAKSCIMLVSVKTGAPRKLTTPDANGSGDRMPKFSPSGKEVAFIKSKSVLVTEVALVPAEGGKERVLTSDNRFVTDVAWTQDGGEIVFSSNRGGTTTLWRISPDKREILPVESSGENVQSVAIARKGNALAYVKELVNVGIWRYDLSQSDPARKPPMQLITSSRRQGEQQYSPDGKYVVFSSDRSGDFEIWRCDSDGANPVQLTSFGGPPVGSPICSPDGRLIAFDSRASSNGDIYVVDSDGGVPRQLTREPSEENIPSWSHDGKWIYFSSNRTGTFQLRKISVNGEEEVQVTKNGGLAAYESNDGRYLYYVQKPSQTTILRMPAGTVGDGEPVDNDLRDLLSWGHWNLAPDGIYFYKLNAAGGGVISFYDFKTKNIKRILVTPGRPWYHRFLSASPDGRWLLYPHENERSSDIMLIQNFR